MAYFLPDKMAHILEASKQDLLAKGLTDEQIESQMKISRLMQNPINACLVSIFSYGIIGSLVSLIVAAITKKENPNIFAE